jgi:hypothetical protein
MHPALAPHQPARPCVQAHKAVWENWPSWPPKSRPEKQMTKTMCRSGGSRDPRMPNPTRDPILTCNYARSSETNRSGVTLGQMWPSEPDELKHDTCAAVESHVILNGATATSPATAVGTACIHKGEGHEALASQPHKFELQRSKKNERALKTHEHC